jgi:5,5'-dehydrodivanillate O-demethylase oxygenase subunit
VLTESENERLTKVGPGTPTGELMRRYWQPFLPAAALLDNPVQKVRLLGEDLVCYQDRSGTIGLIGDRCAHRLVSMEFGIPVEEGIRCPYHGWCYDETGACVDTPFEPAASKLKDNVRLTSYPVQELGGLLFAYMGPAPVPLLPPWELFVWPNAIRQIGYSVLDCNWLQCQENAADPMHGAYLHGKFFQYVLEREGLLEKRASDPSLHKAFTAMDRTIGFSHILSEVDEFGLQKALVYKKELGATKDRVQWYPMTIFPHNVRVGGPGTIRQEYQIRVPIDDTHTYHIDYQVYIAPDGVEVPEQDFVPAYVAPIRDANGKPILDYVLAQDMVAWWSQGPIADRSLEHLGLTDTAIVQFRNLLNEQVTIVENGGDPMNVYRDPATMPSIIHQQPLLGEGWDTAFKSGSYWNYYHRGYGEDDVDRYGPAMPLVIELSRRIEEFLEGDLSKLSV